jgi:hypothetical protein
MYTRWRRRMSLPLPSSRVSPLSINHHHRSPDLIWFANIPRDSRNSRCCNRKSSHNFLHNIIVTFPHCVPGGGKKFFHFQSSPLFLLNPTPTPFIHPPMRCSSSSFFIRAFFRIFYKFYRHDTMEIAAFWCETSIWSILWRQKTFPHLSPRQTAAFSFNHTPPTSIAQLPLPWRRRQRRRRLTISGDGSRDR